MQPFTQEVIFDVSTGAAGIWATSGGILIPYVNGAIVGMQLSYTCNGARALNSAIRVAIGTAAVGGILKDLWYGVEGFNAQDYFGSRMYGNLWAPGILIPANAQTVQVWAQTSIAVRFTGSLTILPP